MFFVKSLMNREKHVFANEKNECQRFLQKMKKQKWKKWKKAFGGQGCEIGNAFVEKKIEIKEK